jgi:hypothetical protein
MTRRSRPSRWARARPCFGYDMTEAEAANFLGISSRYLGLLRRSGRGPHHVQWRRKIWYSLSDLDLFYKVHSEALPILPAKLPVTPPKIDSDG